MTETKHKYPGAFDTTIEERIPWAQSKDPEVPLTLKYPQLTAVARVHEIVEKYPNFTAYEFMGRKTTYAQMWEKINRCARSLKAIGVREGDRVTVCLPNCPQCVDMFYAINMVGAVAVMIHPLSAESEIAFYLRDTGSVCALTLDQFFPKFENVMKTVDLPVLLVTSISDELSTPLKIGYYLTQGRKIAPVRARQRVVLWKDFLNRASAIEIYQVKRQPDDPCTILYSGGTTGTSKGIELSNMNLNALSAQIVATNPMFRPGDKMLAVMPMFHGFGLGVTIHSMLANGGDCLLIPRFNAKSYAEMLDKYKPNFIAGVPSLYEALLRNTEIGDIDLSCLKGVFSGGDSLSTELKKRFDKFLSDHHAPVTIREGYGTTECVTASCLTPIHKQKEGSIGIPFPDTFYKIVKPNTEEELPYGQEGEICLSGPTVMIRYINQPEETAMTRRLHQDGRIWIHTGDLGLMDEEGFVYFRQRIKRMIVTNGYNVYPSQMENILDANEYVQTSCVIGVPDPVKVQKVKAFIVLKPGYAPTEATKQAIMEYCRKHIAKYALPYDIEFRENLPKTLVGKVAYRVLEEEELAKIQKDKEMAREREAYQKEQEDRQKAEDQAMKEKMDAEQAKRQEEFRKSVNKFGETVSKIFDKEGEEKPADTETKAQPEEKPSETKTEQTAENPTSEDNK